MNATVEELFPDIADEVRGIITAIRTMVRDAVPEATEILYHGALGYGPTSSGFDRILYVTAQRGYANLGFFYGGHLSDPEHLLEGTGKRMRHVKIRSAQAVENPALAKLVRDAWNEGVVAVAAMHASRKKQRVETAS
jgi:hypothetical protein